MRRNFRFKSNAAMKAFRALPPDSDGCAKVDIAAARVAACFSQIEIGLSRLVYTGLVNEPDAKNDIWKNQCEKIRKLYGMKHMERILRRLVHSKALIEDSSEYLLFGKCPTVAKSFLDAIEIAARYRNALAHEGFVYLVSLNSAKELVYDGLVEIDGMPTAYLYHKDIIRKNDDGTTQNVYISFQTFVWRLSMSVPPYFMSSGITKGPAKIDAKKFLHSRANKWERTQKDMMASTKQSMIDLADNWPIEL